MDGTTGMPTKSTSAYACAARNDSNIPMGGLMSERDRGMAIALLAEAYNVKDLTPARIRIYDQALAKVPQKLLEPMVQKAIASRTWFPKVAELLADAEACRQEMVKSLGDYGCAECDETGWKHVVGAGSYSVRRCDCWWRHQDKLATLGVGYEPLMLPASREWQEN